MLKPQQLHDYQRECVLHQMYNDESMLWLQMGLGKTPVTLTTIVDRMRAGQVQKVLIFGPLRVIPLGYRSFHAIHYSEIADIQHVHDIIPEAA
jgi:ERCC4-related helicase